MSGLSPPRKNAYGRPTSKSSMNLPLLMRWMTLTTAPTAPAIRAATGLAQPIVSQTAATMEIVAATEAIPLK